ncbi:MAG TPA: GNAT family N-acetyltransferase [bacterium]|nr:GNAT family N-acetyltransferase [bacterium]
MAQEQPAATVTTVGGHRIEIVKDPKDVLPEVAKLAYDLVLHGSQYDPVEVPRKELESYLEGKVLEWILSDTHAMFVAKDGDVSVAYLLAEITLFPMEFETRKRGLISGIYVERRYRREGLGKRLLDHAYRWFDQNGVRVIELVDRYGNDLGRSFWAAEGFEPSRVILRKVLSDELPDQAPRPKSAGPNPS